MKVCYGCHGFELPMVYFDFRVADELNFRVGRFSPSFGAFNLRHDPANHRTQRQAAALRHGAHAPAAASGTWACCPSPFPDNGVEINGTHWFGERVQLDYAAYAVSGFRAPTGSADLAWALSQTRGGNLIDNNGRPAGGGRVVTTFRVGEGNDVTVGGSVMYGTWDPRIASPTDRRRRRGRRASARTQLRLRYLVRRQTYAPDPAGAVQAGDPAIR